LGHVLVFWGNRICRVDVKAERRYIVNADTVSGYRRRGYVKDKDTGKQFARSDVMSLRSEYICVDWFFSAADKPLINCILEKSVKINVKYDF
jgi:hypothetical protein